MNPKQKAIELVDKFYQTTPNESWINEPLGIAKEYKGWNQSKECALIAVEEIMLNEKINHSSLDKTYEYWEEVKNEIQKL